MYPESTIAFVLCGPTNRQTNQSIYWPPSLVIYTSTEILRTFQSFFVFIALSLVSNSTAPLAAKASPDFGGSHRGGMSWLIECQSNLALDSTNGVECLYTLVDTQCVRSIHRLPIMMDRFT